MSDACCLKPVVCGLYVITDRRGRPDRGHLEILRACIEAGVEWVQIREKELGGRELADLVAEAMALVEGTSCRVLVNDRADVALVARAHGVHVGREDLPVVAVRSILPEGMIVGASAKTPEEAKEAQAAGADYLGVGAIFPSPTKPDSSRVGLEGLRRVRAASALPIVAIGGICGENIGAVARAGADAAAVISAVAGAHDMVAAIRRLQGEFARGRADDR